MSDWNCCVCIIESIKKHPDADLLSIATVLGDFPVVIKTGQYTEGQIACYLSIDTIVPDTEEYHFLCPRAYEKYEESGEIKQRQLGPKYPVGSVPEKYRIIKSKRMRGTYSQGMIVNAPPNMNVGDSVVDVFGLKKWEESEEESIAGMPKMHGSGAEKPPQGFVIPKYDIDGLRKYLSCLRPDEEIVLTEKIHGANAAFCHDGERLWVRSRNWFKKMDEDDPWWDIAIRYDLENKLKNHPMIALFGELYGLVKGFRYDTGIVNGKHHSKIRFFDVWDAKNNRYLDYDPFKDLIAAANLDLVPELYRGVWTDKDSMYPYAEGLTTLGSKHVREGFVCKPVKERYEPKLDSRMIIKLVGEGYNLAK